MEKLETLWHILMYDSSPGEKLHAARVGFRLGVLVFVVWGAGFLAPLGLSGFAKANEVDQKIKAAVDPIYEQLEAIKSRELKEINNKLETGERMQKRILATQISAQLRDLNRMRCSTSDNTLRSRMEQDIEEAELEYKGLTGERYPLPACKDL